MKEIRNIKSINLWGQQLNPTESKPEIQESGMQMEEGFMGSVFLLLNL